MSIVKYTSEDSDLSGLAYRVQSVPSLPGLADFSFTQCGSLIPRRVFAVGLSH